MKPRRGDRSVQSSQGARVEQAVITADGGGPVLALRTRNLAKRFGGNLALKGVDLDIEPGEVVALLGENGSGKSTLVKILAGYHEPEPGGELLVSGQRIPLPVPHGSFREHGLAFVFQDLGLAPELTVVENLFVGRRATTGARGTGHFIDWRRENRQAREVFARYGVDLDPGSIVARQRPTNHALLAIVRAAEDLRSYREGGGHGAGVLVLDEPTVFLPEHEKVFLFDLVRRIAADGAGVLFVSHDMTAVREIAGRAAVLRDGEKVGDVSVSASSDADLIQLVSGHRLDRAQIESATTYGQDRAGHVTGDVYFSVRGLRGGRLKDVSLDIRAGEILGVAGLLGSGSEDLPYALFGDLPDARGELTIGDWSGDASSITPSGALELCMALVPGDRKQQGIVADLPVALNMLSLSLKRFSRRGFLNLNRLVGVATERAETYDVRPRDVSLHMSALSGGNQQKVLLARWLERQPRVLLLHEPTQGVDVATRHEIYKLMEARARDGVAVLWVSTDFDELATVANRILLCAGGVIAREMDLPFSRDRITSELYDATTGGITEMGDTEL